ncbi:MAG: hypothetical protein ACK55Z_02660, partial [bacterium]
MLVHHASSHRDPGQRQGRVNLEMSSAAQTARGVTGGSAELTALLLGEICVPAVAEHAAGGGRRNIRVSKS